jgi:uncharacterized protein
MLPGDDAPVMAHVEVHEPGIELESPTMVEGLPGVGLVGKIATDHLVDLLDMTHYASCYCDGLPEVAVYSEGDTGYKPPVRIYTAEKRDLLALQSDVPVSPNAAREFAGCVNGWLEQHEATPLYLSGLPEEKDGVPELYGVASGDTEQLLAEIDVAPPSDAGVISGPTGALLFDANRRDMDALGFVVQSNKNFPDPEAARVVLVNAVEPIADVDVETGALVEQAEQIQDARERLAKQMQEAQEESSQAQPLGMYQ